MSNQHPVKIIALAVALAAAVTPAFAHHSASMYDGSKSTTVTGTVKVFSWTNPHVNLEILPSGPDGKPGALWTLEGSSPGVLTRSGWNRTILKPGDKVTVTFNPLRTGALGGFMKKVVLPDGHILEWSLTPSAAH